jgi:hypothetical protein
MNTFTNIDICHFVNTSIISIKKSWSEALFHGEWTVSGRNGGSDYNSPTFLSNPQVRTMSVYLPVADNFTLTGKL